MPIELRYYQQVPSTMDVARDLALQGELGPNTLIFAGQQTSGRGRFDRSWISPPGNLYMSYIAEDLPAHLLSQFALLWGVVIRDCLSSYTSGKLQCKWPNDVLLDGQKICGVLIEKAQGVLIVGVGLNLVSVPENVLFPATCLSQYSDRVPEPKVMAQEIGDAYLNYRQSWEKDGFENIRQNWLKDAWRLRQEINIRQDDRSVVGIFETIDEAGALILKNHPQKYYTGDVFKGD